MVIRISKALLDMGIIKKEKNSMWFVSKKIYDTDEFDKEVGKRIMKFHLGE